MKGKRYFLGLRQYLQDIYRVYYSNCVLQCILQILQQFFATKMLLKLYFFGAYSFSPEIRVLSNLGYLEGLAQNSCGLLFIHHESNLNCSLAASGRLSAGFVEHQSLHVEQEFLQCPCTAQSFASLEAFPALKRLFGMFGSHHVTEMNGLVDSFCRGTNITFPILKGTRCYGV